MSSRTVMLRSYLSSPITSSTVGMIAEQETDAGSRPGGSTTITDTMLDSADTCVASTGPEAEKYSSQMLCAGTVIVTGKGRP